MLMLRKAFLFGILFLALALPTLGGVQADGPQATTGVDVNLRTGPGSKYSVITVLRPNVGTTIEARTQDTSWILVKTLDGQFRGWGKTTLFKLAANISLRTFPVSTEEIKASTPAPSGGGGASATIVPTIVPMPAVSGTAPIGLPVVAQITPAIRASMRNILAKGKELGNNPRVFSKVGDCQTDHWAFLKIIGWARYNLDKYSNLQSVINYFGVSPRGGVANSFDAQSQAAHNGFNSSAVMETAWADPAVCQKDESPLDCEYRLNKPAVSIIMFGTADVMVMAPYQFNDFMHQVVKKTMDKGIIPLLSTFPENPTLKEKSRTFNQLVVKLAQEKSLPIMNLADALKPLANWGLETDLIHLTLPPGEGAGVLSPDNLKFGYTMRNLVVLQSLDAVWRGILN